MQSIDPSIIFHPYSSLKPNSLSVSSSSGALKYSGIYFIHGSCVILNGFQDWIFPNADIVMKGVNLTTISKHSNSRDRLHHWAHTYPSRCTFSIWIMDHASQKNLQWWARDFDAFKFVAKILLRVGCIGCEPILVNHHRNGHLEITIVFRRWRQRRRRRWQRLRRRVIEEHLHQPLHLHYAYYRFNLIAKRVKKWRNKCT